MRCPAVVTALAKLPDDTVIDGEIVAFDQDGRPSFNALQNYGSAAAPVVYYVFDVMVLAGRDVMREPLEAAGRCSNGRSCRRLAEPVRHASSLDADMPVLIASLTSGTGDCGTSHRAYHHCHQRRIRPNLFGYPSRKRATSSISGNCVTRIESHNRIRMPLRCSMRIK